MRIREPEGADELVLNLTPLIDVVFLLLVFFMVATTFLDPERELDIDLPEASSGELPAEHAEELVISVDREGRVVVAGKEVDPAGLARELHRAAERDPETPVTIRGDRLVHHEDIVAVLDACGGAGLHVLALGTLEPE